MAQRRACGQKINFAKGEPQAQAAHEQGQEDFDEQLQVGMPFGSGASGKLAYQDTAGILAEQLLDRVWAETFLDPAQS